MAQHNQLGKLGEDLAVKHLIGEGYEILTRNYVYQKAEVDIIAKKGNTLAIVEVKTRSTDWERLWSSWFMMFLADYDFPITFNMPAVHEYDNRTFIVKRELQMNVTKEKTE